MFIKVRRAFTVGVILFLLCLFVFPSLFLQGRCQQLGELCGRVVTGVDGGDTAAARAAYETLKVRFEAMRAYGELFLDHKVMDDASRPLTRMGVYLDAGDGVALRAEAADFLLALNCILAIETVDLGLFL